MDPAHARDELQAALEQTSGSSKSCFARAFAGVTFSGCSHSWMTFARRVQRCSPSEALMPLERDAFRLKVNPSNPPASLQPSSALNVAGAGAHLVSPPVFPLACRSRKSTLQNQLEVRERQADMRTALLAKPPAQRIISAHSTAVLSLWPSGLKAAIRGLPVLV